MHWISSDEDAEYVADLTFDALSYEELHNRKLPPPPSNVRLAVRHRRADFATVIALGHVSVPGAPWFGARLVAFVGGTLFVGIDNGLLLVAPATVAVTKRLPTGNTEVSQIAADHDRNRVYVLNESCGFKRRGVGSNLAAYGVDGSFAWRAPIVADEWSASKDYTQIMAVTGARLDVATWSGRAELDAESGRLLQWWFTK